MQRIMLPWKFITLSTYHLIWYSPNFRDELVMIGRKIGRLLKWVSDLREALRNNEYSFVYSQGTIMEKYVDLTPIANSFLYGSVYKFWLRQLVTVFAPFALLTIINLKTILQLKKHLTPKASLRTDNDYRARRSLGKVGKFIRDDKK